MAGTFEVFCGCGCGEAVKARDAGFSATSVEVLACARQRAAGVVSMTMRKSAAFAAAVPATALAHRDGLVAFA